jgi:squalene synthase HpnC
MERLGLVAGEVASYVAARRQEDAGQRLTGPGAAAADPASCAPVEGGEALPDPVLRRPVRNGQQRQDPAAPAAYRPADGARLTAQAGEENFPVALWLLPARQRRHLMAVYGFARTVDDIGDEAPRGQRQALLGELEADLRRLYHAAAGPPRLPAVAALVSVVRECSVPITPFADLIRANRQDQAVSRYQTFDSLMAYCALSANPVGRIVLYVFGAFTPDRAELSDKVCSALQIIEHCQDVAEDYRNGRIYLPMEDMTAHGCTEDDLAGQRAGPALRSVVAFEAARARELLDAGAPLIGQLRGAARGAVAGYVAGGRAALAALAAAGHDVLAGPPKPRRSRTAAELLAAWARGR